MKPDALAELRAALGRCAEVGLGDQSAGTFAVLRELEWGDQSCFVSRSPDGFASLLLPGMAGEGSSGFATRRLVARPVQSVTFDVRDERRSDCAVLIECRDHLLLEPFTMLASQIASLLATKGRASWPAVHSVLTRWAKLFAEQPTPDAHTLLGLWGELWMMSRSRDPAPLLAGWRGADGGVADYVVKQGSVEVKTSRRPFEHHVSQTQSSLDAQISFVVSLAAERSDGGERLADLVARIVGRVDDSTTLYEGLARWGVTPTTLGDADVPRVLLSVPAVFSWNDVPRVRACDAGVSEMRYKVTLNPDLALDGAALRRFSSAFGLQEAFSGDGDAIG